MGMMKRLYEDFTESAECQDCGLTCSREPSAVAECQFWHNYVLDPSKWDDSIKAIAAERNPGPMPEVEKIMTPDEFAKEVQELYDRHEGWAGEEGHRFFDGLVEDLLRSLGYGEGFNIFNSMSGVWYA